MRLSGLNGQVQADFEHICAGDWSEPAVVSDGVTTVTLPCLFDESVQHFDPETNSHVLYPGSRMTVAETATDFNLRRAGLSVTIRGTAYTVRRGDWEFDGLGQLILYLDKVMPSRS